MSEKGAFETRPACNCSLGCAPLESGGEKSVGTMHVAPKAHASARLERDALLGENGVARQGLELGVRSSELVGDRLVFGFQDAAGRVYQPAAGLYEPRSRTQDGALLLRELRHCLVRVAPFEVGIAAQGAESTARRIDQNAVELPRQPLCPPVVIPRSR